MKQKADGGVFSKFRIHLLIELICAFVFITILAGCASSLSQKIQSETPKSSEQKWAPAPGNKKEKTIEQPLPDIPSGFLEKKNHWGLIDLVDLALRNNPQTRATWYAARSAAAQLGSEKSSYYPNVGFDAAYNRTKASADVGKLNYLQASFSPVLSFSFLIYDFGGREATIEENRQALIAANWTHNAAIQDLILQVETAYYDYLYAKALAQAEEVSLKQAKTNYDAANDRHLAGVATIADVLQAKTALSQAQLALDTVRGQILTIRGALASSVGLPASTEYDIEDTLPENIPLEQVTQQVEQLIEKAKSQRPDLESSRSLFLKADAHTQSVKTKALPSITLGGNVSRLYYENNPVHPNTYSWTIDLHIPVFTGFSQTYNELQAKADAEQKRAQLATVEHNVILQVWTSYYNLKTAEQLVKTSKDLLDSAQQSYDVALGRYKSGVGSILDLLSAQDSLEKALAQRVQARTSWFLSIVQLAHDTGTLALNPAAPGVTLTSPDQKGGKQQ